MPTSRRLFQLKARAFGREVERFFRRFEDLGAAGVEDPGADVGEGEGLGGEEGVDVAAEVFEDYFGHVRGEDYAEAGVADVPAHDVLGVAVEGAAGGEDLWSVRGRWVGDADSSASLRNDNKEAGPPASRKDDKGGGGGDVGFVSGEDDGGAAVAEEAGGDEVCDGLVVVLPGEGAEFYREEENDLLGKGAEVVRGAGDAGGSSDAAEAEDRACA